ncbi:FecR domain-containing protein [Mucilaginibacter sp. JRF]|uniref:FecR family protein n=1 Tax=Mucilaginibacter sp. JRF TaxID=2780088 RepID=UPI00188144A1|nr:FecR family protein [Mucilaginibacter sp. JRF]MBE9583165.1 FecR domain-containing protein [Mucilaginibacter sp. JRF]
MTPKQVEELLAKYAEGTCTEEEKLLLESLYDKVLSKKTADPEYIDQEALKASIYQKLPKHRVKRIKPYWQYAAAAIVLLCISVTVALYMQRKDEQPVQIAQKLHDIAPGGNVATLTLSNGKKIALTDSTREELAKQAGVSIVKSDDGQLIYSVYGNEQSDGPVGYNIAETPKGGQYQVHLADGTTVWLNASSSLKFPVRFAGKDRVVELTGEAYFEVAHNASKPFIVKTLNQQVQVLGTQFNVNSYDDEPAVVTTLVQGSVKVSSNHSGQTSILKPGEQSLLSASQFTVRMANLDEAIAWKNGYFRFKDEKIGSIMRKLSRWYDVDEVEYIGKPSDELFTGKISRFRNISQVLNMLEKTDGAHFKIEGRRIKVMP